MLAYLFCYYHRTKLDAFIDGELSPRLRRRVAQHLDHCPRCDRAYIERRQLRRELQRSLPLVGQRETPDFAALWGEIRAELPRRRSPRRFRYGLVMMMLLLALVVPFTMGNSHVSQAVPNQPEPHVQAGTEVGDDVLPIAQATAVASMTDTGPGTPPTLPEPARSGE